MRCNEEVIGSDHGSRLFQVRTDLGIVRSGRVGEIENFNITQESIQCCLVLLSPRRYFDTIEQLTAFLPISPRLHADLRFDSVHPPLQRQYAMTTQRFYRLLACAAVSLLGSLFVVAFTSVLSAQTTSSATSNPLSPFDPGNTFPLDSANATPRSDAATGF